MIRSSVDLPPPDGPSRAVSWPVGRLTETSSRATKSPNLLLIRDTVMLMGTPWLSWAEDRDDDEAHHRGEREHRGDRVRRVLLKFW